MIVRLHTAVPSETVSFALDSYPQKVAFIRPFGIHRFLHVNNLFEFLGPFHRLDDSLPAVAAVWTGCEGFISFLP